MSVKELITVFLIVLADMATIALIEVEKILLVLTIVPIINNAIHLLRTL
jgi:hypothetical protein